MQPNNSKLNIEVIFLQIEIIVNHTGKNDSCILDFNPPLPDHVLFTTENA